MSQLNTINLYALSYDELKELRQRVNNRLTEVGQNAFKKGDGVTFTHKGQVIVGVVEKVNRKTVNVITDGGRWKCAPSLLTKR